MQYIKPGSIALALLVTAPSTISSTATLYPAGYSYRCLKHDITTSSMGMEQWAQADTSAGTDEGACTNRAGTAQRVAWTSPQWTHPEGGYTTHVVIPGYIIDGAAHACSSKAFYDKPNKQGHALCMNYFG